MPQSMETDSEATESGPADERIRLLRNAGKRVSGYMVSRRRILESWFIITSSNPVYLVNRLKASGYYMYHQI